MQGTGNEINGMCGRVAGGSPRSGVREGLSEEGKSDRDPKEMMDPSHLKILEGSVLDRTVRAKALGQDQSRHVIGQCAWSRVKDSGDGEVGMGRITPGEDVDVFPQHWETALGLRRERGPHPGDSLGRPLCVSSC